MTGSAGTGASNGAGSSACLAAAGALAGLPGMSPSRLARLLRFGSPERLWRQLSRASGGNLGIDDAALVARWRVAAATVDLETVVERYRSEGVNVHWGSNYPELLAADPWAPAVLFSRGDISALRQPSVAIIGTRNCTHEGREIAAQLGAELTEGGVTVVSGLALGIDGAAHRGALGVGGGARPVGVAGNGLDRAYPTRHAQLWREVSDMGVIVSEAPLGARPDAWRFPARNRIIAALADVVVVVESHERGGSLLTVEEAIRRGKPVMAVPGSIRNSASGGTNHLIADGCAPVRIVDDIFAALSLEQAGLLADRAWELPETLGPDDQSVLDAVDHGPTSTDTLLVRTGFNLPRLAGAMARLELLGVVVGGGGWWERQWQYRIRKSS